MRVQVVKDGQVIPGQEANFQSLCERETKELQEIDEAFRREDPDAYKNFPVPDVAEAKESLISASYRFGVGDIWMDISEH